MQERSRTSISIARAITPSKLSQSERHSLLLQKVTTIREWVVGQLTRPTTQSIPRAASLQRPLPRSPQASNMMILTRRCLTQVTPLVLIQNQSGRQLRHLSPHATTVWHHRTRCLLVPSTPTRLRPRPLRVASAPSSAATGTPPELMPQSRLTVVKPKEDS